MRLAFVALAAFSALCAHPVQTPTPQTIWVEGETPVSSTMNRHPYWYDQVKKDELSGGDWISNFSNEKEGTAEYRVRVGATADFNFFVRANPVAAELDYLIDSGTWTPISFTGARDQRNVAVDGKVDLRFLAWVTVGKVTLKAGDHTIAFRMHSKSSNHGALDCFVLTTGNFVPTGKLKPGEKYNRAPAGWFPFEPDPDNFGESPIDLRSLNEKFAGENGSIQVKGEEFVHGKTGEPVRFWAVNCGGETVNLDHRSIDVMARHFAKLGVNMVRVHGPLWNGSFRQVDKDHLDKLFYFIAALKKQGIYTTISIYFPLWLQLKDDPAIPGYKGQNTFALLYFNSELQSAYRSWWKALLNTLNPYTGKPLSEEPAVASAELVNEDSYLFWTFNYDNIPGPQMALLEKEFGKWLAVKYGSLEKAFMAWGRSPIRGDSLADGRAGFRSLWEISHDKNLRSQDTAAFLTQHQMAFYEKNYRYLKHDLGFKGLIYGSNWITADANVLGPLDKYSNTVCDFMDRHGYFGGPHQGPAAGYSVRKGDKFDDRCALLFKPEKAGGPPDFNLPIFDIRYNGKPSTITEINWPPPNRFRADMPLLCAAYGLLQGTDGFYFFATGSPTWEPNIAKFAVHTPVTMGQFPAAALIYRRGLVKQGNTVVEDSVSLNNLYALKGVPIGAPQNLDDLRKSDVPAATTVQSNGMFEIDPRAFLVGKVGVNIGPTGAGSRIADMSKLIDRSAKTVHSQTGELTWDYGNGLVTINSPNAQGVTGYIANAGTLKLGEVSIKSAIEYGAIVLVSMDGKPISSSGKMLLQVMSEEMPYGWDAPGSGLREIKDAGGPPIVIKNLQGLVTLKRPDAENLKVTALDFNGYRTPQVRSGTAISLDAKTLYYLIEK